MFDPNDPDLTNACRSHLRTMNNRAPPMMDRPNVQVDMALYFLRSYFFGDRDELLDKVKFHVTSWTRTDHRSLILHHVNTLEVHVKLLKFGFVFSIAPTRFLKGNISSCIRVSISIFFPLSTQRIHHSRITQVYNAHLQPFSSQFAFFLKDIGYIEIQDHEGVVTHQQRLISQSDVDNPPDGLFSYLRKTMSASLTRGVAVELTPLMRFFSKHLRDMFQRLYVRFWKSQPNRAFPSDVSDELWNPYTRALELEVAGVVVKVFEYAHNHLRNFSEQELAVVENLPLRIALVTRHNVFFQSGTHSLLPRRVPLLCQSLLNDTVLLNCNASVVVCLVRPFLFYFVLYFLLAEPPISCTIDSVGRTHGARLENPQRTCG